MLFIILIFLLPPSMRKLFLRRLIIASQFSYVAPGNKIKSCEGDI